MAGIVIIDYGSGNLRSVEKAFAAVGRAAQVSDNPQVWRDAEKLVLPGVGAFAACMKALRALGGDAIIKERAATGVPLLGVCVGMQMLFEESEEFGATAGLGLLRGRVQRFDDTWRVPHVGWNTVTPRFSHPLLKDLARGTYFYFVHSYFCHASDDTDILGETEYGVRYASVVGRGNICGVQFHPEKSQAAGLRLLKNFAEL